MRNDRFAAARWIGADPSSAWAEEQFGASDEPGRIKDRGVTVADVDPTSGFKIDADSGERITFSGAEFIIRASSDSTGGVFGIVEEIDPLDTPLHVHKNEDEFWYVLEGEHVVQVGDNEFHVVPARWPSDLGAFLILSGG